MKKRKVSIATIIFATIVTLLILFPFYWIVVSSFKSADTITRPDLIPTKVTLDHYRQLFSTSTFVNGLINSIKVAVGTMIILVPIVVLASYGLYRFEFKGKKIVNNLILLAYVFPGILLIVPVYNLMSRLHLLDTLFALIVMNITFAAPFCTWLMNGFFASIPKDLDEAAALDGLGKMGILVKIILPLLRPGIATIIIYGFISAWTEYTFASILINSDKLKTLPIVLKAVTSSYTIQWGQITAAGTLTMLPVLIVFAFVGKYFVGGLTSGAVKG